MNGNLTLYDVTDVELGDPTMLQMAGGSVAFVKTVTVKMKDGSTLEIACFNCADPDQEYRADPEDG
jgi:hypothetical protein